MVPPRAAGPGGRQLRPFTNAPRPTGNVLRSGPFTESTHLDRVAKSHLIDMYVQADEKRAAVRTRTGAFLCLRRSLARRRDDLTDPFLCLVIQLPGRISRRGGAPRLYLLEHQDPKGCQDGCGDQGKYCGF